MGRGTRLVEPASLEVLDGEVAVLHREGVDLIAINGGDGTLHRVVTAVIRAWGDDPLPTLVSLQGGTMNTVARSMGARGTPGAIADELRRQLSGEHRLPSTVRHVLQVDRTWYGFLFGVGMIARYIEVYDAAGEGGPTQAAVTLARLVGSMVWGGRQARAFFERIEAEVSVDGVMWDGRQWLTVGAGTVDDAGLGFRPFYRSVESVGALHAIGVGSGPLAFAADLLPIRRARPMRRGGNVDGVGDRLVIRATAPLRYNLDGDLHDASTELEVRIGPALTWLLPGQDRSIRE